MPSKVSATMHQMGIKLSFLGNLLVMEYDNHTVEKAATAAAIIALIAVFIVVIAVCILMSMPLNADITVR